MGWLFQSNKPEGLIKYYGLVDWWVNDFSTEEQTVIQATYKPLGFSENELTKGIIKNRGENIVGFLSALSGWFNKPITRDIAYKILAKGQEFLKTAPVLEQHFYWQSVIEVNYRDRTNPRHFEMAMEACRQQIALALNAASSFKLEHPNSPLPSHKGYEQLAIILEKEKKYSEAIELSREALGMGWGGSWETRIKRCSDLMLKVH